MDWSEGELKERHFEILPQLLTALNTRQNANKALELVFTSIVPLVGVECLEEVIFSEFCHLTADYYCELISTTERLVVSNEDEDIANQVGSLIEACLEVLQNVWSCMEYLASVVGQLRASGIKSLATGALVIVEGTYKHCQESASTYGTMFSPMSGALSEMFKKSFALHSGLLRLVEEMQLGVEEEEEGEERSNDMEILAYVANKSALLCDLVSKIDRNATIGPWKFIFRMCGSLNLEALIDSSIIITTLLRQITSMLQELQEMHPSEKESQSSREEVKRSSKFIEFLFRILGFVVEKWRPAVGGLLEELAEFILTSKDISILNVEDFQFGDETLTQDLKRSISVATDSLVGLLADSHEFLTMMMYDGEEHFGSRDVFKRLLVLLTILRRAESVNVARWSADASTPNEVLTDCTLVRLVFKRIEQCSILMMEPLSVTHCTESLRPFKTLTLYEEALRSIGSYIVKLHEKHFPEIEEILLENLFHNNFFNSLMSSDLWYFLARISPDKIRWQHFSALVKLLEMFHQTQGDNFQIRQKLMRAEMGKNCCKINQANRTAKILRLLVKRIFYLLPTNQQVAVFEAHPIMWMVAPPPRCPEMKSISCQKIHDCICNLSLSLDTIMATKSSRDLCLLLNHLISLTNMAKLMDTLDLSTLVNLKLNLEKLIRAMLCSVRSEFNVRNRVISLALSMFLGLVAMISTDGSVQPSSVQNSYEDLTRMLQLVTKSIEDKSMNDLIRGHLCLAFCPFIESLSEFEFRHKDKGPVRDALHSIAGLTGLCSAVGRPFVREHLLQVFADFLRRTPNPEVPLLIGRAKLEGGAMVTQFMQKTIGHSKSVGYYKGIVMENLNPAICQHSLEEEDEEDDDEQLHEDQSSKKSTVDDTLSTIERCLASLETLDAKILLEESQRIRLTVIKKALENLL